MVADELATVRIFRFDPEVDATPRYDEFKVPYQGYTVLDVIRYIYENLDSTFAFRWACNGGFCRACVVSVNGEPALACNRPAEASMKLDPHPRFRLMKDLLVDLEHPKESKKSRGVKTPQD